MYTHTTHTNMHIHTTVAKLSIRNKMILIMFMLVNIYNAPTYTRAYPGLCPRKIFWCPGKNNVEAIVKHQLIACVIANFS